PSAKPDQLADLEQPLALPDSSFDSVLLMNLLEHIFEYRALLGECARVVKPGGRIVIVVPYLFPYHASPDDFHRYSASALRRALTAAGYTAVNTVALGTGVFAARWLFIERLLPRPLAFLSAIMVPCAHGADWLFSAVARAAGKKYDPADYALGFLVTATKKP
ncbi:MAG TPA: methyltransferase domain-containing protein, partial [Candidatus Paceibacterota bacterium]|nr:methyltransferase domain-containing protein [Candidatus Paceibacterota bacterium]